MSGDEIPSPSTITKNGHGHHSPIDSASAMYEFKWTRDTPQKFGPYSQSELEVWMNNGNFPAGVFVTTTVGSDWVFWGNGQEFVLGS